MSTVVDARTEAQRIASALTEIAALRDEVRALHNLLEVLLMAISPDEMCFLAKARQLEALAQKADSE